MMTDTNREIGVRAFRIEAASLVLKAVAGESCTITQRGEAVARLVPASEGPSKIDLETTSSALARQTAELLETVAEGKAVAVMRYGSMLACLVPA